MKLNNQITPLIVEILECQEYGLPKKIKLDISLRSTRVAYFISTQKLWSIKRTTQPEPHLPGTEMRWNEEI